MRFIFCLSLLFLVSCSQQKPSVSKDKLSGYWMIQSVEMSDGTKKDFGFNPVVDFIEVSDTSGSRTKVAPQFDGSFKNNGEYEKFTVKIENDSLNLYYKTPFDNWKETVLIATDSLLKIKNKDAKIYSYKKFVKFNFD